MAPQNTTQVTPEAYETERAILGAILTDPNGMLVAIEALPPTPKGSWFNTESHRQVYDAMLTLFERGSAIDPQTVSDILRRRGQLEKMGGAVFIMELMESCFTTANIAHHANIVRDKALYRSLINVGTAVTQGAYAQEDITELIGKVHDTLLNIAGAQITSNFTSIGTLLRQSIDEANRTRENELTGIHTGFHELDRLTSGFQNGNLIILAARPSMGKSALALQFALAASRSCDNLPVVLFSLEMSKEELSSRLLCSEASVDSMRMKRGILTRDEFGMLMNAGNRMLDLNILIDDKSAVSCMDIRTRTKRLQMEHGLGMILVDYLQLMSSSTKKENRQQEVSAISRELKQLAKELNVPIVALSQLSREVEGRSLPVPVLSDLRESGAIEQDADLVMFIYRGDIYESKDGGTAKIIIAKQRNGPTGEVELNFHRTFARFYDPAYGECPREEHAFTEEPDESEE